MCCSTGVLGTALGVLGTGGVVLICVLPMWRVKAFIGVNIITAQIVWEGLWMNCVIQSTGQMQCKVYDSLLVLPQELLASRAMIVISIILGVLGVVTSIVSSKCTNCIKSEPSMAKVRIASGVFLLLAGLLVLISVFWITNTVYRDFYNPFVIAGQRRELGASLYIGWGVAALLLIGGAMLCRIKRHKQPQMAYSTRRIVSAGDQCTEDV